MKFNVIKGITIIALAVSVSACGMSRTQKNTATGAAIGGLAGNILGGDMTSTVAGAALGGVIGSQIEGRERDYDDDDDRYDRPRKKGRYKRHYDDDDDDD